MSYSIDKNLEQGMNLLAEGKKVDTALKLINKSARKGTTKGKSFFEVGKIIREGVPGLEPNIEESRKYYDAAFSHFFKEQCDSLDYREMGDYFYFGLGTEAVNKNRALEYYDLASKDGDELASERAEQVRKEIKAGTNTTVPVLTPETYVKEVKPEVVPEPVPVKEEPKEEKPVEEKPVEVKPEEKTEEKPVVAAPVVQPEEKPAEAKAEEKPETKVEEKVGESKPATYKMDKNLEEGINLLAEGKKVDTALKLINKSARKGTTKGKSYFEVGTILREGRAGIEPDVEKSRKYFDAALSHFYQEECDSLDYREMGDYFCFGLGTEAINKNRALEYYDLAYKAGDEVAKERADQIRREMKAGTSQTAPVLTPETVVKEVAPEIKPEPEVKPIEETKAPIVVPAPVVTPEAKPIITEDPAINKVIDEDQLLIKAIRLIDDSASSLQEKEDGVELADAACDQGSMRAAVLMGFLYQGEDQPLVETNLDLAKKYYETAIERGSINAEFRLGLLYLDDSATYKNDDKGHELILDSARKGYSYALCYLGDCFRAKTGDVRNLDVAYRYYALAGERGLGLGYHNMAEIDASRQQIDLARKHETYASQNGYNPEKGEQDPLFCNLHL